MNLAVKIIGSLLLMFIGALWSIYALMKIMTSCLRHGTEKTFGKKSRSVPKFYESWKPSKDPGVETKWKHSYVTTPNNGMRFHFVRSGQSPDHLNFEADGQTKLKSRANGRGPKLVLCLHGFPECWFSWRHLLREFDSEDETSYFVVAVDTRGYGGSDVISGISSYHLSHLSSDVKNIVTSLGYDVCTLVSHDWGGVVAWEVVERYPEVLDGLFVINCPHPNAGTDIGKSSLKQTLIRSWYMFFFSLPVLPEIYISHNDFWFLEENLNMGGEWKKNFVDQDEMDVYKYSLDGASINASINYYRALVLPIYQHGLAPKTTRSLTVKFPIRLVWGTEDPYMDVAMAERTKVYLPGTESSNPRSEVLLVPDAGHFLQQDEPELITKMVKQFLADLED
ncbi:epoxide hydrolase 4-like [Ciona intestinalis]